MARKRIVEIMIDRINASGLSRRELCERAGVSKSWLDRVMQRKKTNIMTDQVQAIIDVLDKV
jgi:transcriptional regulator with XRE-family HTH domain